MSKEIKQRLYSSCEEYVQERLNHIQEARALLKESAASETKSSAGDKHETGRAKLQLEEENLAKQMAEAQKLQEMLRKIDPQQKNETVAAGALVLTEQMNLYVSISRGKVDLEGKEYFVISPTSPIFQAFKGKREGEQINFNGQTHQIISIT